MHQISDDNEKVEKLLKSIDNELIKQTLTEKYRATLLVLKFTLLSKSAEKTAIDDFVHTNLSTPDFLIFVIKISLEKNDIKQAKALAQKGLQQKFPPSINTQIDYFLLQVALAEKNQKKIVHYAYRQFFG